MLRIGISGVAGRMGKMVLAQVIEATDFKLACAVEAATHPSVGRDVSLLIGGSSVGVVVSSDVEQLVTHSDVVIDFTAPWVTCSLARACAHARKALVSGTTGLTDDDQRVLQTCANDSPIVYAPNMSVGVNLLLDLVAHAANQLGPEYDIEIVEAHHRMKKDAPSGTALKLAEVIAEATASQGTLQARGVYGREGIVGVRPSAEIGIHAVRGGDIVGEHTVYFCTDGERIEITHRASRRETFARGAVRAARWIHGKPAGLYSMRNVLGLS